MNFEALIKPMLSPNNGTELPASGSFHAPSEDFPGADRTIGYSFAKNAIEAILFAAGEPVPLDKLARSLELDTVTVAGLCDELAGDYESRGIQILSLGNSRQICTREHLEPYISSALGIRTPGGLSQSSLEVLAIIAYNQPATRVFIEQVRGTDSAYGIANLTERGLIECVGKLDVPGRPNLYATTPDFLRCFGISSLSELPDIEALSMTGETDGENGRSG